MHKIVFPTTKFPVYPWTIFDDKTVRKVAKQAVDAIVNDAIETRVAQTAYSNRFNVQPPSTSDVAKAWRAAHGIDLHH